MTTPEHSAPQIARRVVETLKRQTEGYERLDALSRQQHELIECDDPEALLALLAQRQAIVDELARGGREIEALREPWDAASRLGGISAADRELVQTHAQRLALLAESLMQRDETDRQLLQERAQAVQRELGTLTRGRGAMKAYGPPPQQPGPRYEDREA